MSKSCVVKSSVRLNLPTPKPKTFHHSSKQNFTKMVGDQLVQFTTKATVTGEDYHNLKTLFQNQSIIEKEAKRILMDTPEISLQLLKDKVNDFIKYKGIRIRHYSTINNALRLFHGIIDKGGSFKDDPVKYLMFNESSINNGRFTLNYNRDKLILDYLNIVIRLDDKLPSNFVDNQFFYLNISCLDIDKLDSLQVNFQSPTN